MQTIVAQLDQAFRDAIRAALNLDADPLISVSQNEKFGDYQSNAAMGLAKQVSQQTGQKANPRQIAEQIKAQLGLGDMASEISIAGPGFINVKLSPEWLARQLQPIDGDERVGIERTTAPQRVVVDYSGPNLAKEMHVGHLRGTIIGDVLARTLEFQGHQVIRQNHIGDWGLQMGMVTYGVEQAGISPDKLSLRDLERLYKQINTASEDPVMRRQMAERTSELQQTDKSELKAWKQVRDLTLRSAQELYQRLGVTLKPEDVRGESFYSDRFAPMVEDLLAKGIARETEGAIGIFPSGFVNREGEPRPFIVRSRDGSFQYPTFDLAALMFRVRELNADRIIYTHDSRQAEHFAMLFEVARMLGLNKRDDKDVRFEYAPFGTVLGEDGKPLKTREGENVKLAELCEEAEQRAYKIVSEKNPELAEDQKRHIAHAVGIGAVKYADLSKDRVSDYIFSWDQMLALVGNTAPYLQYAYARVQAIFRKGDSTGMNPAHGKAADAMIQLTSPYELALAKHILRLGEIVDLVARELKPHHLTTYLFELATKFSAFYENCPVLQSEGPVRHSRLRLCELTGNAMALGLDLLGIEHPKQM